MKRTKIKLVVTGYGKVGDSKNIFYDSRGKVSNPTFTSILEYDKSGISEFHNFVNHINIFRYIKAEITNAFTISESLEEETISIPSEAKEYLEKELTGEAYMSPEELRIKQLEETVAKLTAGNSRAVESLDSDEELEELLSARKEYERVFGEPADKRKKLSKLLMEIKDREMLIK